MKVLTANRLTDGVVVYRDRDGGWTDDFDAAERLEDANAPASLAAAETRADLLVGP